MPAYKNSIKYSLVKSANWLGIEPLRPVAIESRRHISSDYKDISVHLPIPCLAVKLTELLVFKDHLSAGDIQPNVNTKFRLLLAPQQEKIRHEAKKRKKLKMLNALVWRWKKVGQADETKHDTHKFVCIKKLLWKLTRWKLLVLLFVSRSRYLSSFKSSDWRHAKSRSAASDKRGKTSYNLVMCATCFNLWLWAIHYEYLMIALRFGRASSAKNHKLVMCRTNGSIIKSAALRRWISSLLCFKRLTIKVNNVLRVFALRNGWLCVLIHDAIIASSRYEYKWKVNDDFSAPSSAEKLERLFHRLPPFLAPLYAPRQNVKNGLGIRIIGEPDVEESARQRLGI